MALNVGAFVVMQRQRARAMEQAKKRRQKPAYDCSKCSMWVRKQPTMWLAVTVATMASSMTRLRKTPSMKMTPM